MKASRHASAFLTVLSAFALLGTVALTGCSSSAISGPDAAPSPQVEAVEGSAAGNAMTEDGENNGGGTEHGASHNTMPEDD